MDRELLNNIQRYLNGRCTLQELEAWALSNLQRILDSGDESAIDAANQLDADLIELGEGLIDETHIREHLQSYIGFKETLESTFYDTVPLTSVKATAAADTIRNYLEVFPVVDLRLAHEFA